MQFLVKMCLNKPFYKCRIAICIFLALMSTVFLSSFLETLSYSIGAFKTPSKRTFAKKVPVDAGPGRTMQAGKHNRQSIERNFGHVCSIHSSVNKYLIRPLATTNFTDWAYEKKITCPQLKILNGLENVTRLKYSLYCTNNEAALIPSITNSTRDIDVVHPNNTCLEKFIDNCCTDHRRVPNVVHYVWYFHKEMEFYMFLSMLSVIRFIRPCLILFHGEFLPYGKYWDHIVHIYPQILRIVKPRPLTVFGKNIYFHAHSGDIMRIEALKTFGGIYLDNDIIVLRDLEALREYEMTLCSQEIYLHSAFVMAKKNATFLNLWMNGYRKDYKNESYVYNAMIYTKEIAENRTDIIHVEEGTLCSPNELVNIRKATDPEFVFNWSTLYAFHLYQRKLKVPKSWDVQWIRHSNTTLGSMVRHIVFGNKELCK